MFKMGKVQLKRVLRMSTFTGLNCKKKLSLLPNVELS